MTPIEKLIEIAKNEIGYLEKKSNSSLEDKTSNAGSSNYTKYWRDIKPDYQGQPWCACFVTWCFEQAFGKDNATKMLKHYPYVYCPTMANLFELYANPQVGDVVVFYRGGVFCHTGIVTKVNGDYFETVEGNTSGGNTIVANGGGVCRKTYYNSNLPGTKFCRPDYSIVESEGLTVTQYEELKKENEGLKARLDKLEKPMIYNYVDENMPSWAKPAVRWCIEKGIIVGTGDGLGLSDIKLWTCVVMYRLASSITTM